MNWVTRKVKVRGVGIEMECGARFSDDGRHRYELWRRWKPGPYCNFILLNPSKASHLIEDPTMTRGIDFAMQWGYGAMVTTNIQAFCATDPDDMKRAMDPTGEDNERTLAQIALGAGVVVCGWGLHGRYQGRDKIVLRMLRDYNIPLKCLAITKGGFPKHPLYIRADQPLIEYR